MKLLKCNSCKPATYTFKEVCPKCKEKSKDAHYKFIKIRDAPTSR